MGLWEMIGIGSVTESWLFEFGQQTGVLKKMHCLGTMRQELGLGIENF